MINYVTLGDVKVDGKFVVRGSAPPDVSVVHVRTSCGIS